MIATLISSRSVQLLAVAWVVAILLAYLLGADGLPFERPALEGIPVIGQIAVLPLVFITIYLPIPLGVTYFITRRRAIPDISDRAPERALALKEMLLLLAYGAAALILGQIIGRLVWGEGSGLHRHGSVLGATTGIAPGAVIGWTAYNFVAYAVIPYVIFRMRAYGHEALSLKSSNIKNDTVLVPVILAMGVALDLAATDIFDLTGSQVLRGLPLTFAIYLFGTAIPVMIFLYCILLPRYLKLSGSVAATVILGGLTYAALHIFEYWTVYDTLTNSILSVLFVFHLFTVPGMVKSFLTLRTGNAWVHVWAYHAFSPHLTFDTPNIVRFFKL